MRKMLLSFKADVYERVLSGEKIYEYRKVFPDEPIEAYLYVSNPIKAIVGIMHLGNKTIIESWKEKYLYNQDAVRRIDEYLKQHKYAMEIQTFQNTNKIKIKDKSSASVVEALEGLRRKHRGKFSKMFKSITSDNGTEFSDAKAIEEMGIKYFYAHSYCSYERGSNENNNKLIRRFIAKGMDIGSFSKKRIKEIEKFMNNYPRKMFGGLSSNAVYNSLEKNL